MQDCIRVGHSGGGFISKYPTEIPPPAGSVYDIRVTRSLGESISTGSGISDLLIAYNQVLAWTPTISGYSWRNLEITASGIINKVETTNYEIPTSIFYNIFNGADISGNNTFYQRLSGQGIFYDMSTSIPPTKITVIRVDDKI